MAFRSTTRDAARRVFLAITRGTLRKADDGHLMQELHFDLHANESKEKIERFQDYGFSSVPLPKDQGANEQTDTQANSTGSVIPSKEKAAEVVAGFINGNRAHAVVLRVDDRRHRPNDLKEGESVVYDDQGQQVYISRDRIIINSDKEVHIQRGDAHAILTDGKIKLQYGETSVTITTTNVFLGAEGVTHAVVTTDGPSQKVFAAIAEGDGAVQSADVAKRTEKSGQIGQ